MGQQVFVEYPPRQLITWEIRPQTEQTRFFPSWYHALLGDPDHMKAAKKKYLITLQMAVGAVRKRKAGRKESEGEESGGDDR